VGRPSCLLVEVSLPNVPSYHHRALNYASQSTAKILVRFCFFTGCGRVVNNTLTSPGYPNNYPFNMDCVYNVSVPNGMALKITFQDFHLDGYDSRIW